jgi:hypothetical protein
MRRPRLRFTVPLVMVVDRFLVFVRGHRGNGKADGERNRDEHGRDRDERPQPRSPLS